MKSVTVRLVSPHNKLAENAAFHAVVLWPDVKDYSEI